jgi:xylulokinase
MGVALTAGGALAWLQEKVASGAPADRLMERAAEWPPGCEGLRFAPYLAGERTPHADPDVRGAFVGLDLRHDLGAMTRAVLEGVAYALRDSLELLRELDIEPRAARLSGGGGRGRLWPQIVASVLGLPLEIPATESAAAFGAALLGGVSGGVFADVGQACRDCVRTGAVVEPVPAWKAAYDDGYESFRRLYPALRTL